MNRRSFLKSLGLLAAVPFVPVAAFGKVIQNPDIGYKCYKSNAETLGELIHQIRLAQKHSLLQPAFRRNWSLNDNCKGPSMDKIYGVISVKPKSWDYILSEIQPQAQFTDVGLLDKGFDNFFVLRVPILKRG